MVSVFLGNKMSEPLIDSFRAVSTPDAPSSAQLSALLADQLRDRLAAEKKGLAKWMGTLGWGKKSAPSAQGKKTSQSSAEQGQIWARALESAGFADLRGARVEFWGPKHEGWEGPAAGSFANDSFAAPRSGRAVIFDAPAGARADLRLAPISDKPEDAFWTQKLELAHELGHLAFAQRERQFDDGGLLAPTERDALEVGIFGHLADNNWLRSNLKEAAADCWGALALAWSAQGAFGAMRAIEKLIEDREAAIAKDAKTAWGGSGAKKELAIVYHTADALRMALRNPEEWMSATPSQLQERAFACASAGVAAAMRPGKRFIDEHGEVSHFGRLAEESFRSAWTDAAQSDALLLASAFCWKEERPLALALPATLHNSAGGQWLEKNEAALHERLNGLSQLRPQSELARWRDNGGATHNASFERLGRSLQAAVGLIDPMGELGSALERQSHALKDPAKAAWDRFVKIQTEALKEQFPHVREEDEPARAPAPSRFLSGAGAQRTGMAEIQERMAEQRRRRELKDAEAQTASMKSPDSNKP